METIEYNNKIEFDNITVNYMKIENKFACHIKSHDIYFGAKDIEMIKKKAKAFIAMKEKFERENPQYKK